jgi:hypothetical protein
MLMDCEQNWLGKEVTWPCFLKEKVGIGMKLPLWSLGKKAAHLCAQDSNVPMK